MCLKINDIFKYCNWLHCISPLTLFFSLIRHLRSPRLTFPFNGSYFNIRANAQCTKREPATSESICGPLSYCPPLAPRWSAPSRLAKTVLIGLCLSALIELQCRQLLLALSVAAWSVHTHSLIRVQYRLSLAFLSSACGAWGDGLGHRQRWQP